MGGFEPPTSCFQGRRSNQAELHPDGGSDESCTHHTLLARQCRPYGTCRPILERAVGIGPTPQHWHSRMQPLHHARKFFWSERRELNPHPNFGKVGCNHYTTLAFIVPKNTRTPSVLSRRRRGSLILLIFKFSLPRHTSDTLIPLVRDIIGPCGVRGPNCYKMNHNSLKYSFQNFYNYLDIARRRSLVFHVAGIGNGHSLPTYCSTTSPSGYALEGSLRIFL